VVLAGWHLHAQTGMPYHKKLLKMTAYPYL